LIVSVRTNVPLTIATPEHDCEPGQDGAELAAEQSLERDALHRPDTSCMAASTSRRCRLVDFLDDLAVGEEEDAVGERRACGSCVTITVVWPSSVDRLAEQAQHLVARVRIEVAGRLVREQQPWGARGAPGRLRRAAAARRTAARADGCGDRRCRRSRAAPRASRARACGRRSTAAAGRSPPRSASAAG